MTFNRLFAIFGLVLLVVIMLTAARDVTREWKQYQSQYLRLLSEKGGSLDGFKYEVKQIYIEELGLVDRCVTCHLSLEDPRSVKAPQPFTTHPDIAPHTFEKFGCTLCHEGQGRATTYEGAAHEPIEFFRETILPPKYTEAACGKCHRPKDLTDIAPRLARGYELYQQKGCAGCHRVGEVGGSIGPELTQAGSKFGLLHLQESIVDPKANDPNSIMPALPMSQEEVIDLTVFLKSLVKVELPNEYRMDVKREPLFAQEKEEKKVAAAAPGRAGEELGKELYVRFACSTCHMISGAGNAVGPDLTHVASRRDEKWLFDHFKNPQAVVPGSIMPNPGLSDEHAQALTYYMLTLK